MSKRAREMTKVLMVMDSSTHNGKVLERCMAQHSKDASGVEYLVANQKDAITPEDASNIDVVVHAVITYIALLDYLVLALPV